jgi:hypothetical protein
MSQGLIKLEVITLPRRRYLDYFYEHILNEMVHLFDYIFFLIQGFEGNILKFITIQSQVQTLKCCKY